jgi:hypothetical protein
MRSIVLALSLALGAPVLLGGCDKIKELTGDKSSSSKKDDDDDDDDRKKKKKKKDEEKGDAKSAKPDASSSPALAAANASSSHLPPGCQVVVTASFSKLLQHPAVAKEIVPLLEEIIANPNPKDDGTKKAQEFLKATGLSLKSFHNGAFCAVAFGPGKGNDSFGFAVGGDIKPASIIPALERSSIGFKPIDVGGLKALSAKNGGVAGQFADGVIGLTTSEDIFKSMNAPAGATYKIEPGRELSFATSDAFIEKQFKDDKKSPEPFKTVKNISGWVDLSLGKAEARMVTGSPDDAKKLDGLVALLAGEFAKDQPAGSVEELLFKSLKSRIEGNDVVVELPIPEPLLAKGAAMLAAELKKVKPTL